MNEVAQIFFYKIYSKLILWVQDTINRYALVIWKQYKVSTYLFVVSSQWYLYTKIGLIWGLKMYICSTEALRHPLLMRLAWRVVLYIQREHILSHFFPLSCLTHGTIALTWVVTGGALRMSVKSSWWNATADMAVAASIDERATSFSSYNHSGPMIAACSWPGICLVIWAELS